MAPLLRRPHRRRGAASGALAATVRDAAAFGRKPALASLRDGGGALLSGCRPAASREQPRGRREWNGVCSLPPSAPTPPMEVIHDHHRHDHASSPRILARPVGSHRRPGPAGMLVHGPLRRSGRGAGRRHGHHRSRLFRQRRPRPRACLVRARRGPAARWHRPPRAPRLRSGGRGRGLPARMWGGGSRPSPSRSSLAVNWTWRSRSAASTRPVHPWAPSPYPGRPRSASGSTSTAAAARWR